MRIFGACYSLKEMLLKQDAFSVGVQQKQNGFH